MKFFKLWVPVFLWAGVIFYFSGIPGLNTGLEHDFIIRKLAHIAEYFILTLLLYRAVNGQFCLRGFGLFIYPAGASLLYAVSDELHQLFIASRQCSALDILIDALGIAGFYLMLKRRKG